MVCFPLVPACVRETRVPKLKETREAFERRLLLFWEIAQPLRHVFQDLPALDGSMPLTMTVTSPVEGWTHATGHY